MSIQLSDNIKVGQQLPLESKYFNGTAPYIDVAQAESLITIGLRHRGLTVNINGVEYWFKDGIADGDLVIKESNAKLVALPFTTDHLAITNNEYVINDLVYYSGNVYRCIANNDSLQPDIAPAYWTNLGAGFPLVQQPADWNSTSGNNQILNKPTIPVGTVTSVGLSMPSAFTVANSPVTGADTLTVTGAGLATQYIRGDGQLANFPSTSGGGSSVAYYLNGSVSQGTFGGDVYYQLSKTPIFGAGTNFTRTSGAGNGYIASFISDAGDPSLLSIPAGNWTLEFYFNASSNGGNPRFYGELYKVDSSNVFTLIASESANPEFITNGTNVDQYFTSISVPQTTLLITDRIAIRIYVIPTTRNITLHTENSNLSEVLTTFSTGLTALNGLTEQVQFFATGTSGTDFGINSTAATHTFNLPTASATNRGALSSADWTTFNNKASGNIYNVDGTLTGNRTVTSGGYNLTLNPKTFYDNGLALNTSLGGVGTFVNSISTSTIDSQLIFYPNSGINASQTLNIIPRGTGFNPVFKSQFTVYNTDAIADSSNTEFVTFRAAGSLFTFASGKFGTGTIRPLMFSAGYATDSATNINQLYLSTAGNVLINSATDAGYKLDVNGSTRITGEFRIALRPGVGGQQLISFTHDDVYNKIKSASHTYLESVESWYIGSNNGNVYLGVNSVDRLSNVGIGYFSWQGLNASAILDIKSTNKGILIPRMSTTDRGNIIAPATGLQIYNTTTNINQYYNGTNWRDVSPITVQNFGSLFSTGLSGTGVGATLFANNSNFFGVDAGYQASVAFGSNFFGESAGYKATYSSNSNFIGGFAGELATLADSSNFIGYGAGSGATNASYSNFIGAFSGGNSPNAANSIFIGKEAGNTDSVNNTTNGLSSILIGNNTNTGGFSNSILLGSGINGSLIANTKANQFMLADTITNVRWRGIEYTLPASQAATAGQVLSNNGSGVLSWVAGGIPLAGTINAAPITGRLRTTNNVGVWSQWGSFDGYASKQVITGVISGINYIPDDINGNATQGIHYGQVVGFGDAYSVVQAKSNDFDGSANVARIYAHANYGTSTGRVVVEAYEGLIGTTSNTPYLTANSYVQKNYVDAQVATKQNLVILTTTGSTGAATFNQSTGVLNIPNYVASGGMAIGGAITSATVGSILFAGTSGVLLQDNSNFFWDNNNKRLAIGATSPAYKLEVAATAGSATSGILVKNTGTNPSDYASLNLLNNNNILAQVFNTSSGYSTNPLIGANGFCHYTTGAGGLTLWANGGIIKFASGSNAGALGTQKMTLFTTGNLCIGTTTDVPSSILTLNDPFRGFLPPRLNTANRGSITTPATGLQIYNTDTNTNQYYNGTTWVNLSNPDLKQNLVTLTTTGTTGTATFNQTTGALNIPSYVSSPIALVNTNSLFSTSLGAGGTTTAQFSVLLGFNAGAGLSNSAANNLVFIGQSAGQNASQTQRAIFIGDGAGLGATSSQYSIFIGAAAGGGCTFANDSIFIGVNAGNGALFSRNSIIIGLRAGLTFTDNTIGRNNIIIGTGVSLPSATVSGMNIGGVLFGVNLHEGTAGNPSIVPTATGRIGIGVVTPTANLHIKASTTAAALMRLTVGPAPTSPNDGDIWLESNTQTGLKIRLAGVTRTFTLT